MKLADFKGKVIILNFWATWCSACKVEIPDLIDLQAQYANDGLQVLGVSADDPLDKLRPYVAESNMNYSVLQGRDHHQLLDAYAITVIPTSFVIGRDGEICATHIGAASKGAFENESNHCSNAGARSLQRSTSAFLIAPRETVSRRNPRVSVSSLTRPASAEAVLTSS